MVDAPPREPVERRLITGCGRNARTRSKEREVRLDDRLWILEEESRRPERIGEIRALGFELRGETAVEHDRARVRVREQRPERVHRDRHAVPPLAHRCLPHVVRLRPSVAGV